MCAYIRGRYVRSWLDLSNVAHEHANEGVLLRKLAAHAASRLHGVALEGPEVFELLEGRAVVEVVNEIDEVDHDLAGSQCLVAC